MAGKKHLVDDKFFNEVEEALSSIKESKISFKLLALKALKEHTYSEIKEFFNVSRNSLTEWQKAFKYNGIEGLKDKPRGHRPSKLNEDQIKEIELWISEAKNNEGKKVNWTIEKLRLEILEVFGLEVGKTPLWIRLRKMNFVLKTPRPEHHKSDKASQEAFKKNTRSDSDIK